MEHILKARLNNLCPLVNFLDFHCPPLSVVSHSGVVSFLSISVSHVGSESL